MSGPQVERLVLDLAQVCSGRSRGWDPGQGAYPSGDVSPVPTENFLF